MLTRVYSGTMPDGQHHERWIDFGMVQAAEVERNTAGEITRVRLSMAGCRMLSLDKNDGAEEVWAAFNQYVQSKNKNG